MSQETKAKAAISPEESAKRHAQSQWDKAKNKVVTAKIAWRKAQKLTTHAKRRAQSQWDKAKNKVVTAEIAWRKAQKLATHAKQEAAKKTAKKATKSVPNQPEKPVRVLTFALSQAVAPSSSTTVYDNPSRVPRVRRKLHNNPPPFNVGV